MQPKVSPGPGEPDWEVVLRERYGLVMFADLKNPVKTTPMATPGLFRKAGPGPVKFSPGDRAGTDDPDSRRMVSGARRIVRVRPRSSDLWSYELKNSADDLRTGKNLPPRA